MLAFARAFRNVLYGHSTCDLDRSRFQRPAQLPIAAESHRIESANVAKWVAKLRQCGEMKPYSSRGSDGGKESLRPEILKSSIPVGRCTCPNSKISKSRSLQQRKNRAQNRATRDLTRAIDQARGVDTFRYLGWLLTPNRQKVMTSQSQQFSQISL